MTSLCLDLFEDSCPDSGCRFIFMSSNFAELDYLRLLVLHLLLQGGKNLEKLVAIERWLGFGGLHLKSRGNVGMGTFSVRDVNIG